MGVHQESTVVFSYRASLRPNETHETLSQSKSKIHKGKGQEKGEHQSRPPT